MFKLITICLALAGISTPVFALTAVCKEPKGQMVGVIPSLGSRAEINDSDGMTGGLVTVIWERGSNTATFITQGSGGGVPNYEKGIRVLETEDQISCIVGYSQAIWLYSLFPKVQRLLITSHGGGDFQAPPLVPIDPKLSACPSAQSAIIPSRSVNASA